MGTKRKNNNHAHLNSSTQCLSNFRSPKLSRDLLDLISKTLTKKIKLMEVCGTHTVSIFRHGIRELLPRRIKLISGPGCPVCVTSAGEIDVFISLANRKDVIIATFGDMIRVPGPSGSLARARAKGAKIEVVYSPIDALKLAQKEPQYMVVFLAIGFETTAPTVAATVKVAKQLNINNFTIYCAHKLMPPALEALFSDPTTDVDGLLCPGHVSAIIGAGAYEDLAKKYNIPCVVSGFEPADILYAIYLLAKQIASGEAKVENAYPRAVTWEGNKNAIETIYEVFEPVDAKWRGLGLIPNSGLALREKWEEYDAVKRLDIKIEDINDPPGCRCGDILRGVATPPDCKLFGTACTPLTPVGPCMVSTEGTCAAYYRYGEK